MKTGALVLGIIGGLVALIYGLVGHAFGSLAHSPQGEFGPGEILQLLSIGLPIAALVGAGLVKAMPLIGAGLMAISAVGFIMIIGFNTFSLVPVLLLGVAALLGFLGMTEKVENAGQS